MKTLPFSYDNINNNLQALQPIQDQIYQPTAGLSSNCPQREVKGQIMKFNIFRIGHMAKMDRKWELTMKL